MSQDLLFSAHPSYLRGIRIGYRLSKRSFRVGTTRARETRTGTPTAELEAFRVSRARRRSYTERPITKSISDLHTVTHKNETNCEVPNQTTHLNMGADQGLHTYSISRLLQMFKKIFRSLE